MSNRIINGNNKKSDTKPNSKINIHNISNLSEEQTTELVDDITFSDLLIMRTYIQCFIKKTIESLGLLDPIEMKTEIYNKIKKTRCIPDMN